MRQSFALAFVIILSLATVAGQQQVTGQTIPPGSVMLPIVRNDNPGPPTTAQPAPTPASTPTPTATATPTATSTATATNVPTGPCPCSADVRNCGDFNTQAQAQACFDFCVAQGAGDIHRLDQDNNGVACESLPLGWKVWE